MAKLKAPFPYFGGKNKVADIIWTALGQPKHYIEPFFGSGAVLLARPDYVPTMVETINDKDGFIANVWRGIQFAPDEVAKWCDWPVNHADLAARRKELIENEGRLLQNLIDNPEWFDAKLAGYWIWAASCWIGSGLTRIGQRPHISNAGQGIRAIGQRPHISNAGQGIHAIGQIPHISDAGMGINARDISENIYKTFRLLSERLRRVRVVCGDWTRVCGGDWQDNNGTVGIFFDPPYGDVGRDNTLYHHDGTDIAAQVMEWALARGDKPSYRIIIAGYDEHTGLLSHGWAGHAWKTGGCYGCQGKKTTRGAENRHREMLYFSPHCLGVVKESKLF